MEKSIIRQAAMRHPAAVLQPYDTLMGLQGLEGFDAIYAIWENFGGTQVYVPSIKTIFAGCLENEAMREFNGKNYANLARKYGFSDKHMRRLVNGG